MGGVVMILTEERTSTIEFRSRFSHIDYFKNGKVIVVAFESPKEANLFHNAIVNKYIDMFEVEKSIYAVMLKARDSATIDKVYTDDSLSWLSISLNYACSFAS